MKQNLFLLFFIFSSHILYAQQDAQFSQFMFNNLVYNPAVAGSKDAINIVGLFRTQMVGVDGHPVTRTVSVNGPINSIHSGVGFHINDDAIAFNKTINVLGSYAYKFELDEDRHLAVGLNMGFIQSSLDGSKLKPIQAGDPEINSASATDIAFDLGFGALYTTSDYYLGLSISHLPQSDLNYSSNSGSGGPGIQVKQHYYLTGGYNFSINENLDIKPAAIIKFHKLGALPQAEINALAFLRQKVWFGLSYRFQDAMIGMAGFNVNERLKVGYSYDFTVSKLIQSSNGSHEIFIGYDINVAPKSKDNIIIRSPRFL